MTPFYWLVDVTGRRYDPPMIYPHFFYGFFAVALAWQIAFLVIGSNPARFRALMIPAMLEKFGYVATLAVLYGEGRIAPVDALAAVPDGLLVVLFILAFAKTPIFRIKRQARSRGNALSKVTGETVRESNEASSDCP